MIMRGLTGQEFKDVPLPPLGQKNAFGLGITEGRNERWKTVWWDDLKERGRTGKRLDQGESPFWCNWHELTLYRDDISLGSGQNRRDG